MTRVNHSILYGSDIISDVYIFTISRNNIQNDVIN